MIFDSRNCNYSEINIRSKFFKNDQSTLSIDKIIVTKIEGNEFAISYPLTVGSRTWLVTTIK